MNLTEIARRAPIASAMVAILGTAFLMLASTASAWQPAAPPSKALAERIKRNVARCKSTENLETCDDAVRWAPSDPILLVAFGDALLRTQHPADALRQYQRAAALAPKLPGVSAKISAAQARLPKHGPTRLAENHSLAISAAKLPMARNASPAIAQGSVAYANDASESHSH